MQPSGKGATRSLHPTSLDFIWLHHFRSTDVTQHRTRTHGEENFPAPMSKINCGCDDSSRSRSIVIACLPQLRSDAIALIIMSNFYCLLLAVACYYYCHDTWTVEARAVLPAVATTRNTETTTPTPTQPVGKKTTRAAAMRRRTAGALSARSEWAGSFVQPRPIRRCGQDRAGASRDKRWQPCDALERCSVGGALEDFAFSVLFWRRQEGTTHPKPQKPPLSTL